MLSICNWHSWNAHFKSVQGENCAMTKSCSPASPLQVPSDVRRYHLDIAFYHVRLQVFCDRASSNVLYYPSEQKDTGKWAKRRQHSWKRGIAAGNSVAEGACVAILRGHDGFALCEEALEYKDLSNEKFHQSTSKALVHSGLRHACGPVPHAAGGASGSPQWCSGYYAYCRMKTPSWSWPCSVRRVQARASPRQPGSSCIPSCARRWRIHWKSRLCTCPLSWG